LLFLTEYAQLKEIFVLEGGFQAFFQEFPFCCKGHEKYEVDKAYPSQILPYLYLGGEICSTDLSVLKNLNIKRIINVTSTSKNLFENNSENKVEYLRVAIEDSYDSQIGTHFAKCTEFIDSAKNEKSSILVHCQAGLSRSPTIVIAYIMQTMSLSLDDSLTFVKERRPVIRPNAFFMSQLFNLEEKLEKNSKRDLEYENVNK